MTEPVKVLPGDVVAESVVGNVAGAGTYVCGDKILSSLVGNVQKQASPDGTVCTVLSVGASFAPQIGDVVLAKVVALQSRGARVLIVSIGDRALVSPFNGIVRQQDIRAVDIDECLVSESFAVGDVLRGAVLSMGDRRSYLVTTARPEYGVVWAACACCPSGRLEAAGEASMMRCASTGAEERRKVAVTT